MPRLHQTAAFAIALLTAALLIRTVPLVADPPTSLVSCYHDVASSVFDEGWWTAPARDAALFGTRPPGLDLFWVSPLNTVALRAVFAVAGPSLATARSVPVAAAVVGILVLVGLRRRDPAAAPALTLAAAWLAVSFIASQLGRLALPETLGSALGVAACAALVGAGPRGRLAAGALGGAAFLVKPHFAPLLPALATASALLAVRHRAAPGRAAGTVLAGAAFPLVAWAAYLALHAGEASRLLEFYDRGRWLVHGPDSASRIVALLKPAVQALTVGVIYRDPLFVHAPLALLLAAVALPSAAAALLRPARRTDVPDTVVVFAVWALLHGAFLAALPFQPLRYFLPLLPPLAVLAGWALAAPPGRFRAAGGAERGVRIVVCAGIVSQLLYAAASRTLAPRLVARAGGGDLDPLHPTDGFSLTGFLLRLVRERSLAAFDPLSPQEAGFAALTLTALLSLGAGFLLAVPAARLLRRAFHPETWPPTVRRATALGALALQVAFLIAWFPQRGHSIRDLGKDLQERLGAGPDVVVSPGGTYALSTVLRFDSSAVEDGRMYDASGAATHFLALESHPLIGTVPAGGIEAAHPGSRRLAGYRLQEEAVYGLYRAAPGSR